MSKKSNTTDNIAKLERRLAKIRAAQRKRFLNEDILRLEKNGDLSYETIRTHRSPGHPLRGSAPREESVTPTVSGRNFYTETPASLKNGQKIEASAAGSPPPVPEQPLPEVLSTSPLTNDQPPTAGDHPPASSDGIFIHEAQNSGQKIAQEDAAADSADPLEDLLARALSRPRRGRPAAFDEHSKGKLVALLSLGMSLRQAAAVLGVSHNTVRNTLKADPALADEITAARFQAQLQPLACVIREARRSWKAATWLLKYLDHKIATHEETPDERRQRQEREADEFFARSPAPGVKKRKVLG